MGIASREDAPFIGKEVYAANCGQEGIQLESEKARRRGWVEIAKDACFFVFMAIMVFLIIVTATTRIRGGDPELFGYRMYVVESGSMSPTINVNSVIVVKEVMPQDIKEKDIVTYRGHSGESTVTHRVVEVKDGGEAFVTKGDANEIPDPMPVEASRLIGKVVLVIPYMGRIFGFLSTPFGLGLLIALACLWTVSDIFLGKARKEGDGRSGSENQV